MRVLFIGVLAIITVAIYISVVVYDRKIKREKEQILRAMWDKVKGLDSPVEAPVNRVETLSTCRFEKDKFNALIYKLKGDDIIDYDDVHIWFTIYGHQWFIFEIRDKNVALKK